MLMLKVLGGFLLLILAYIFFLLVCSLLVSPKQQYEQNSPFYRRLLNSSTAVALKLCRVRVHITGQEMIPQDTKKLLFVCNHRSKFDPIVTWYALRKWQIAFISKPENFKVPVFGRFIRKCCFLPIDRENPRNAIKTVQQAAQYLRQGEVSIGIYPEGTRSKGGQLLPFHNGVFKIAQKADAPIVVLSITGTEAIHKNYPWHRTDVYLNVVNVLFADYVKCSRTDALGAQIREEMERSISQCEVTA